MNPSQRFLPSRPTRLLWVAGLAAALVLVAVLFLLQRAGAGVAAFSFLALLASTCLLIRWRLRSHDDEQELWRKLALSLITVAAGIVIAAAGAALQLPEPVLTALLCCTLLAMMSLTYLGVVRWTRPTSERGGYDPDHLIVTICAVIILVTGTQLALSLWAPTHVIGFDLHLPLLVSAAAGLTLVVVLVSTTRGALRRGDLRPTLMATALLIGSLGTVAILALGIDPVPWAMLPRVPWPLVLALCATMTAVPRPHERQDLTISTVGGYLVTAAALPVLAVAAVQGRWALAAVTAAAGVGALARLLANIGELRQLVGHRRAALVDELTGLANRRAFTAHLERALSVERPSVVALLDLNHFKEVNDSLGHGAGDELLYVVAQRLRQVLLPGEVVARLGGDEFVVLASDRAVQPGGGFGEASGGVSGRAAELGHAVVAALNAPVELSAGTVHIGASIGTTTWSSARTTDPRSALTTSQEAARLLRAADAAMYDAKRTASGWVAHDPQRHDDTGGNLALVEELRTALTNQQLELHYQPQVTTSGGSPVGVEALVRWQHPERGLLLPTDFLDLADAHGLMGLLTEEVLRLGIAQHSRWLADGLTLRLSLNLPASALRDVDLPRRIRELLDLHAVPAPTVVLEITESLLLHDTSRSAAVVAALRSMGLQISIDDFGTGYSSLARVRHLDVDELKLDRTFTADLLNDAKTEIIVASTVQLAHALGLRVVAEGVEDTRTLARLEALGCDEAQGYLVAAPMPAISVAVWWRSTGLAGRAPLPTSTGHGEVLMGRS